MAFTSMPLKANEVTVEEIKPAPQRPSLTIQKEAHRLSCSNASEENLPDSDAGSPPRHHTCAVLHGDTAASPSESVASPASAASPSESVASPPFFPTSRHHSFFMNDLDSHAGDSDQSPTSSTHPSLPTVQSPTAAFAGVMARSRAAKAAATAENAVHNQSTKRKSNSSSGEVVVAVKAAHPQAAATGPSDNPSMLTMPTAQNGTANDDNNDRNGDGENDESTSAQPSATQEQAVDVKYVVKSRKHRHRLVATAPPVDPNRAQQWNLLTLGPDPSLPLYSFKEIPHWQKYNPYIRSGYRAFYTAGMCLRSMLGWHNETINVYSHLLTFLAFVVLTVLLYATVLSKAITVSSMKASKLMYAIFCFGSMLCTLNSSIYHLYNCHSHQRVMTAMGRLDFIGITVLIVASFLPPLYVVFHCFTTLRIVYISFILVLGSAAIIGPWTDVFHEHVGLRVTIFLGLGFSGLVPAIHSAFLLPFTSAISSVVTGMLLMVLLYCGGLVFYVTQFPESKFPGHFDFWLSSHQIWHFFVSMAALVHYFNCVSMYQMWQVSDGICN